MRVGRSGEAPCATKTGDDSGNDSAMRKSPLVRNVLSLFAKVLWLLGNGQPVHCVTWVVQ